MPKPLTHRIKRWMLRDRVSIVVVGGGGTGAALVSGLPYLHHALLAAGHPSGVKVCVIDGDRMNAPGSTPRWMMWCATPAATTRKSGHY